MPPLRSPGRAVILSIQALVWLLFFLVSPAFSQDAGPSPGAVPAPGPAGLPPGQLAVGGVSVDAKQRTISFPAVVNMARGNLEYLVVAAHGKTHESLLRTEGRPYQIHVALLLLGAKGSPRALPLDPSQPPAGDRLEIEVSWEAKGNARSRRWRAEQFITDRKAGRVMRKGPWVYNGSRLREDGFAAERDGSIVSLITDADALVNNPRRGREDDDNWLVRPQHLPPLNSAVTVTFRLVR